MSTRKKSNTSLISKNLLSLKKTDGKRSGFENLVDDALRAKAKLVVYEGDKLHYVVEKDYITDWTITEKRAKIYIEAKGRFTSADRTKLLLVKKYNPDADIRLIFQRDNWLTAKHKARYSDWAIKNGFKYSIWPALPI